VSHTVDVAVVGGGIAGVCAACAAAREGARVLLIERFGVTGGTATIGGVGNWSGETRGQGAVFDDIVAAQKKWRSLAPYPGPARGDRRCNRPFDSEILAVILQELLLRDGVTLRLHTTLVDVMRNRRTLKALILAGVSGPEAVRAALFIDATGSAQVARAAGFHLLKPGPRGILPPSLMFFVRETNGPVTPQLPKGWFHPIRREADLPMTSFWPNGPGSRALKVKITGFDNRSTEGLTALEIQARRRMWEVLDFFQRRKKSPLRFDHASPLIGLRETARIAGDYVLSVSDLRAGRKFPDGIARGVFPLDAMAPDCDQRTYLLSPEEQIVPPYHIPFRSLIAADGDNLLMAGRCFSADPLALSSARVMTTCAMMGQAAGIAAARCAKYRCSPRDLSATPLRRRIEKLGANLTL